MENMKGLGWAEEDQPQITAVQETEIHPYGIDIRVPVHHIH